MARQKMTIIMVWSLFFFSPSTLSIITGMTGIDLARLADLPLDVLVESRRVAERLADLQTSHEESSESRKIAIRRKALLRVIPSSVASSCVYSCNSPNFIARRLFCGRCYPVDSDMSSFVLESDSRSSFDSFGRN
jgi:hypothetical protein